MKQPIHPIQGGLIWITGLPGAGKTTIAQATVEAFNKVGRQVIHLDGDRLRDALQNFDYSLEGRKTVAKQISALSTLLAQQQFPVICSTVSLRHEIHEMNRNSGVPYLEVLVQASMTTLNKRNQKNLYERAKQGEDKNVPGVTQKVEFPTAPDLIIQNDGAQTPSSIAQTIISAFANLSFPNAA